VTAAHESGQHPFLNRDGSTDIRALCEFWDDRLNDGASDKPNPIPDPGEARHGS
jgi:hypothetical protein